MFFEVCIRETNINRDNYSTVKIELPEGANVDYARLRECVFC